MNRRLLIIIVLILAIPALGVAYWLGSPLFGTDSVDEALPTDIVFVTNTPTSAPATTGPTDDAPAPTNPPPTTQPAADTNTADEVTAVEVRRGSFRDADSLHQGSGQAIIYRLSDGRHLVRFENFTVTNGPDLRVYLVPHANASDSTTVEGYIDLGRLKGNTGNQNYYLDAGVELPAEASIVIWCEPFRVTFSIATLN